MTPSRREFLATSLTAAAAFAYSGCEKKPEQPVLEGEDGSELWLRHTSHLPTQFGPAKVLGNSDTADLVRQELAPLNGTATRNTPLIVGTTETIPGAGGSEPNGISLLAALPRDSFTIRNGTPAEGSNAVVICGNTDLGMLYGVHHFLRLLKTNSYNAVFFGINITQTPKLQLRLLNHWDNLDGTIERGYAGKSLWNWAELPGKLDPRLTAYARANASIGINGTVLNNVNASAHFSSPPSTLRKVAAIANVFRPWGVRVYLSANFSCRR